MLNLITAIKQKLIDVMPDFNEDRVQVSSHELSVEIGYGFPIIAVLDGGQVSEQGRGGQSTEKLTIHVALYQKIESNREAPVIGFKDEKGVIELAEAARSILENERFNNRFFGVRFKGATGTFPFVSKGKKSIFMAIKIITLEYKELRSQT